jgi:hypothetical protein
MTSYTDIVFETTRSRKEQPCRTVDSSCGWCSARHGAIEALTTSVLPPLVYRRGIAGMHLLLADETTSKVETAESKLRVDRGLKRDRSGGGPELGQIGQGAEDAR